MKIGYHGLTAAAMFCLVLTLSACSTYSDRVAPVPLPALQLDHVEVDGVFISANPYVDDDNAEAAVGASIGAIGGSARRYGELDGELRNDLY